MSAEQINDFANMFNSTYYNELPPATETKPSSTCIFKEGLYLVRNNSIGKFGRLIEKKPFYGCNPAPPPFFETKLPKIPLTILRQQIAFYRQVMKHFNRAEAYSAILYNPRDKEFFLYVPKQKVSKGSVHWDTTEATKTYPHCFTVVCGHSHNDMSAFFSPVDDADEKSDMLYMVMGTLDKKPTYSMRASIFGAECLKLKAEEHFDFGELTWADLVDMPPVEIPDSWISQIVQTSFSHLTSSNGFYPTMNRAQALARSRGTTFDKEKVANAYLAKFGGFENFKTYGFDDEEQATFDFLTGDRMDDWEDEPRSTPIKGKNKAVLLFRNELTEAAEYIDIDLINSRKGIKKYTAPQHLKMFLEDVFATFDNEGEDVFELWRVLVEFLMQGAGEMEKVSVEELATSMDPVSGLVFTSFCTANEPYTYSIETLFRRLYEDPELGAPFVQAVYDSYFELGLDGDEFPNESADVEDKK